MDNADNRAREIINRHYDFPSQRLQYKVCVDDVAAALREPDWQPIETAPKDGTRILLGEVMEGGYSYQGFWDRELEDEGGQCWRNDSPDWERSYPTHWMPLPPPPIKLDHKGK